VVDFRGLTGRPANVDVGLEIDRGRFIDLIVESVAAMGAGAG
jgi:inosine-uridine nucleoside N-ribohydrolase